MVIWFYCCSGFIWQKWLCVHTGLNLCGGDDGDEDGGDKDVKMIMVMRARGSNAPNWLQYNGEGGRRVSVSVSSVCVSGGRKWKIHEV